MYNIFQNNVLVGSLGPQDQDFLLGTHNGSLTIIYMFRDTFSFRAENHIDETRELEVLLSLEQLNKKLKTFKVRLEETP